MNQVPASFLKHGARVKMPPVPDDSEVAVRGAKVERRLLAVLGLGPRVSPVRHEQLDDIQVSVERGHVESAEAVLVGRVCALGGDSSDYFSTRKWPQIDFMYYRVGPQDLTPERDRN